MKSSIKFHGELQVTTEKELTDEAREAQLLERLLHLEQSVNAGSNGCDPAFRIHIFVDEDK